LFGICSRKFHWMSRLRTLLDRSNKWSKWR
jgi:hypothetical protein